MATDIERLIVQLSADIKGYENAMRKAQQSTVSSTRAIERQFATFNGRVTAGFSKLSRAYAGVFAGVAAGRGAQQLVDAATNIDNALKVAGLSGEALNSTYEKLFQSAQKNAAPLDALVTLYSRVSTSAKELNASQQEILDFTDLVAVSLRASGSSAQAASGALLQLAQALGGSKIQAQEFNSLIDGARPLLQAVAFGLKEAGGSVAKLTALVKDGEVSAQAFFRAGMAGAGVLEKQLAGTTFTITQRFGQLYNSLINTARQFNNSTKVAETFGNELENISKWLDEIDWDSFVSELQKVNAEFRAGIKDVREWFLWVSRATGLEEIGQLITGGAAFTEHIPGLRVTSQAGLDDLFERNSGIFKELTQEEKEAAQRLKEAAADLGVAAEKQDRLAVTNSQDPNFGRVSLADHPVTEAADKLSAAAEGINRSLIDTAKQFAGFSENRQSDRGALQDFFKAANQNVDPKMTAWCAAFVNAVLASNGLPGTGALNARSFLNYGTATQDPQPGDLVILKRGSGNVQGHVGFYMGEAQGGGVRVLGGNQGDAVSEATFRSEDVLGYRRVSGETNAVLEREVALRRDQAQAIRELMQAGQEDTARIQLETALVGASNATREREIFIFEQLLALKRQGVELTPEIVAGVEAEAQARFGAVAAQEKAIEASDRLIQKQEELNALQQEIGGAFQGAIKSLISDLVHGRDATEALTDAVAGLADRLLDIALNQIFASLFGGGGGLGGGGGILGGLLGGLFHTGGRVGAGVNGRRVNPAVFLGAQRMHGGGIAGLRPDEVPIIAQRGELVLPRSKTREALRPQNVSPNVDARTTVVNAFDASSFLSEALSKPEGVKVVLNVVRSQPGAFRAAMNG